MDCSLPGSSIHGISQTRILEWVALPFSRGSSWSGDRTHVSFLAGLFFYHWATREAPMWLKQLKFVFSQFKRLDGSDFHFLWAFSPWIVDISFFVCPHMAFPLCASIFGVCVFYVFQFLLIKTPVTVVLVSSKKSLTLSLWKPSLQIPWHREVLAV